MYYITQDERNEGKSAFFDLDTYCQVVEMFVNSDEIERALWMIDNPPGWFRENPPKKLTELRTLILKNTLTVKDYISDSKEIEDYEKLQDFVDANFIYPRFQILLETIREMNQKGQSPNLYELCPASFWLPRLLLQYKVNFQYRFETINLDAAKFFQSKHPEVNPNFDETQPNIFICFETIEHLWRDSDVAHFYAKYGLDADIVMLSTPLNTLLGGHPEGWRNRPLGHLRTYTKSDFLKFAVTHWPNRAWEQYPAQMQVLVGRKI